ncbi:hypothetical protein PMAYCL1PPCAC_31761, partial [Pristionchus mayeri]
MEGNEEGEVEDSSIDDLLYYEVEKAVAGHSSALLSLIVDCFSRCGANFTFQLCACGDRISGSSQ